MIWCLEDDDSIREIVLYTLKSTGFEGRGFPDARSFFEALSSKEVEPPDLLLLDIMLPDQDGVAVLKELRSQSDFGDFPIIMTTAKGSEYDKIKCLDLGADDYMVKPFGMMEMISRIKAVLRRYQGPTNQVERLTFQELSLNLTEHKVKLIDETISLTFKEFELLKRFLKHPNRVFTREELLQKIWGMDYLGETRTVDAHIKTLRQKLGEYGSHIRTIRHVGYSWEAGDR
ncbi:response regulator transcription factor [Streptococcus merionis]|uniref:response regulator transcription factor n=1 Tax=Streptococcus merionis TaxID=400065 RepID=UPI0035125745